MVAVVVDAAEWRSDILLLLSRKKNVLGFIDKTGETMPIRGFL